MCRYACSPFPAGPPAVFPRRSDARRDISDTVTAKKRKLNYTCCLATNKSLIQLYQMVLNLRMCRGETKRGLGKSKTQSLIASQSGPLVVDPVSQLEFGWAHEPHSPLAVLVKDYCFLDAPHTGQAHSTISGKGSPTLIESICLI